MCRHGRTFCMKHSNFAGGGCEFRFDCARTGTSLLHFQVETLECEGAYLTLETSKPGKLPLEFAIAHLKLTDIVSGGAMGFEAELTNPRPVGTIHTRGAWALAGGGPRREPVAEATALRMRI